MGISLQGRTIQANRYALTDVEKAIVDCFDLPRYSGGYAELISAFARAKLSSGKMIRYCTAIHNVAATKRMGVLADFLEKPGIKAFILFARKQVKEAYNALDPNGPDSGEYSREWSLRLNISKEQLAPYRFTISPICTPSLVFKAQK